MQITNLENIDINSQEAQKDDDGHDGMSDEGMDQFHQGKQMALSDDETAISPMKIKDERLLGVDDQPAYFKKQQFAKSKRGESNESQTHSLLCSR